MKWNYLKWCCDAFCDRYRRPIERGARVVATRIDDASRYYLILRSIDPGPLPDIAPDAALSIEAFQSLRHCPWCGTNLARQYDHQDALIRSVGP